MTPFTWNVQSQQIYWHKKISGSLGFRDLGLVAKGYRVSLWELKKSSKINCDNDCLTLWSVPNNFRLSKAVSDTWTHDQIGEKWQIQNRYQSLYICDCHQLSIFHTVITVHFCGFRSHFICGFWENLLAAQAGCTLTTAEDDFELLPIPLLPSPKWWDYRVCTMPGYMRSQAC